MRTFDMMNQFWFFQPQMASRTSERKGSKHFTGGGRGTPLSVWLKKAEYWGFHMRYCLFLNQGWSLQNLEKGLRVEAVPVCFCYYCHKRFQTKTQWIFLLFKYCDHKNMKVEKFNILYQMFVSHKCTNTNFMTFKCIFVGLMSVLFCAYRV